MIEINLLPEEMKKKKSRWKQIDLSQVSLQSLPLLKIGVIVGACLVAIQALVSIIGTSTNGIYGALDRRYNAISSKKQEVDALKRQAEGVKKKIKAIDELMVQRFSWAKKLNDLSDAMTPNVWLTELNYDEQVSERRIPLRGEGDSQKSIVEKKTSRFMKISGNASSIREEGAALVGKFIKSLKSSPGFYSDFSDIELGTVRAAKIEDQEVMSFTLTCYFKDKK